MSTSRLKLYNGALLICGDRELASLTEEQERRRLLDQVWNDGGVRYCLEQGQWKFAMRSSRLDYEPSIEPDWGPKRVFTKPTDWVATSAVCQDEFFTSPLLQYWDEIGYWFADLDQIFVRYVSDDTTYGADMARWPASFTDYVKSYFASRIIHKLPGGKDKVDTVCHPKSGVMARNLMIAKNKDAMAGPTLFAPPGSWNTARAGRGSTHRDRGNRGSLIG